jgi:hypothetical protein
MEYVVIFAKSVAELNAQVNGRLSEGWDLYGSPAFAHSTDSKNDQPAYTCFIQALTKKASHRMASSE